MTGSGTVKSKQAALNPSTLLGLKVHRQIQRCDEKEPNM